MNDELSDELSPHARELLEAGRDADLPEASDRARVRTKLALQLAGAAAGAAAGKAAAQLAVGTKIGVGTLTGKALLAMAVLGVAGVGAGVALRSHEPSPASRSAPASMASQPEPSAVAAPAQPGAAPSLPDEASAGARQPAAPSARGPAAHAAARDGDHDWAADLQAEVTLLARAQRALAAGDPDAALDHLAQHRAQFPKGALSQERRAASAIAHCQAGRLARGRALLADLPEDSPLSARAEETCRGDAR